MAKIERVLVDSNVIPDIAYENPNWRAWSEAAIERTAENIGAHAAVCRYRLLTGDAARYRTYFPTVELIAP